MNTFIVSSGGQRKTIKAAKDPFDACIQAVKSLHFKSLGLVMQVNRKNAETSYCSTERVCKAAGMWGET